MQELLIQELVKRNIDVNEKILHKKTSRHTFKVKCGNFKFLDVLNKKCCLGQRKLISMNLELY